MVEGMSIAGYNASTSCNLGDSPSKGAVQQCVSDVSGNLAALTAYSKTYQAANARINSNYNNIAAAIVDVNQKYPIVNKIPTYDNNNGKVDTTPVFDPSHKYETVDYGGRLIYDSATNHPQYMKDQMMDDARQDILRQNTTYILSTMTVAALAAFVVMASR